MSRTCNQHEAGYGSYKGEMLAVVFGVTSYKMYLKGAKHPFKLFTDHRGLMWLLSSDKVEGQFARWRCILADYDFEIMYKPGVKHEVADVPSRFPDVSTKDYTGSREYFPPSAATEDRRVTQFLAKQGIETQDFLPLSASSAAVFDNDPVQYAGSALAQLLSDNPHDPFTTGGSICPESFPCVQ